MGRGLLSEQEAVRRSKKGDAAGEAAKVEGRQRSQGHAVAAVGPEEDIGAGEEGLEVVGREVDRIVLETVVCALHPDISVRAHKNCNSSLPTHTLSERACSLTCSTLALQAQTTLGKRKASNMHAHRCSATATLDA